MTTKRFEASFQWQTSLFCCLTRFLVAGGPGSPGGPGGPGIAAAKIKQAYMLKVNFFERKGE